MSIIFQHGSYSTLYGGFYEGTLSLRKALEHGTVGIGTLDGADGEVIILDGVAYQGSSENVVRIVAPGEKLPYIAVLEHSVDISYVASQTAGAKVLSALTEKFPSKNVAYSIKISGSFSSVEISSKPPKNGNRPYLDILATQPHFTQKKMKGTIVGIWSPALFKTLYGEGFHLHFISDDKSFGAHLVAFEADEVCIEAGQIETMLQEFPVKNQNFQTLSL